MWGNCSLIITFWQITWLANRLKVILLQWHQKDLHTSNFNSLFSCFIYVLYITELCLLKCFMKKILYQNMGFFITFYPCCLKTYRCPKFWWFLTWTREYMLAYHEYGIPKVIAVGFIPYAWLSQEANWFSSTNLENILPLEFTKQFLEWVDRMWKCHIYIVYVCRWID